MRAIKHWGGILAAFAALLLASPANAKLPVINLGMMAGDLSVAWAINNHGEVVGWSETTNGMPQSFYYVNGQLRNLDARDHNPSTATAINNAGLVVGSCLLPYTNIFVIQPLLPTNFITIVAPAPLTNLLGGARQLTNAATIPVLLWQLTNAFTSPVVSFSPTNYHAVVAAATNTSIQLVGWTSLTGAFTNFSPAPGSLLPQIGITTFPTVPTLPPTPLPIPINEAPTTNIYYSSSPAFFRQGSVISLGESNQFGQALGINDLEEIVGECQFSTAAAPHAFVAVNGSLTDLGALGPGEFSSASAINNHGEIVGSSAINSDVLGTFPGEPQLDLHAFVYRQGTMSDLGTLGGSSSAARAINDQGEIVGWSDTASSQQHPFLYRGGRMYDLGTLGGGQAVGLTNYFSFATAINNLGEIVGTAATPNGSPHAFVYVDGKMTDLNDLVSLTTTKSFPGFVSLNIANGINDLGEIVGEGTYWDGTRLSTRAFLIP